MTLVTEKMASESNALDILYQSAHRLSDAHIKFAEGEKESFKHCVQDFQLMLDNAKIGPKYAIVPCKIYCNPSSDPI